jgi:hypothetical protein
MTDPEDIIIIDDGAYQWGADKDELLEYLDKAGWTKNGMTVREPEHDEDDDAAAHYTALCQAIQPPDGYEVGCRTEDWDEMPSFRVTPQDGPDVWTLCL